MSKFFYYCKDCYHVVCLLLGKSHSFAELEVKTCVWIQEEFEEYAEKAKTLPESTSNENKLVLYGLYKQATVGNVNTS